MKMVLRLYRGDLTQETKCPLPIKIHDQIVAQIQWVWFDGEYTLGEADIDAEFLQSPKAVLLTSTMEKP